MGRSYERDELFGGAPLEHKQHSSLVIAKALGSRVSVGTRVALHSIQSPAWVAGTGEVIAKFEDGSAAVLVNSYGKGRTITILLDASSAAEEFPELVRDIIDYALANTGAERAADLMGTDARMDVAMEKLRDGFSVAVVNHNSIEKEVTVRALKSNLDQRDTWIDAATGKEISGADKESVTLRIPADGFRAVEFKHGFSPKSPARSPNSAAPEHSHE
jgi:hypothetical protein